MKNLLKWTGIFALSVLALLLVSTPATAHAAVVTINVHSLGFGFMGITVGSNLLTLTDWAKRRDPSGKTATIIELLNQTNAMLDDMLWRPGNLTTGHRVTVRTGLPTAIWRLLNAGVPTSKSTTAQIDEMCGSLEARGQVDKDLAELEDDLAAFRLSEAEPFMEAMNQQMQQVVLYGNASVSPEQFTGFATRYSSLSAKNGQNILSGGGVGADNTSIWLIGWGDPIHGIFPKASQAGLVHQDLQEGDAFDANNNRFRAYLDRWNWKAGIALKDWRFAVRIPNIDVSNLVGEAGNADIVKLMSRAIDRIPAPGRVKLVFYASRTVKSMLRVQALNKSQNVLSVNAALTQFGQPGGDLTFLGIPVRTCDQILETEAVVS